MKSNRKAKQANSAVLLAVLIQEAFNLNRDMFNNISLAFQEGWYSSETCERISKRIDELSELYHEALDKAQKRRTIWAKLFGRSR